MGVSRRDPVHWLRQGQSIPNYLSFDFAKVSSRNEPSHE